MGILELGRQGVVDLTRGQTVSVISACLIVVVGLISVSPAAGMLSRLGELGFALPIGAVGILARSARDQAVPKGDSSRSGWPYEGALLLGAAFLFTAAAFGTFAYLVSVGAVADPVPLTLAGIVMLGNVSFGLFALMSYRQRVRD